MISVEEARGLADREFPKGPEALANLLGVDLKRVPLRADVSGWCSQYRDSITVVINSAHPPVRQRFTLAHELAHVLLGARPHELTNPWALFEINSEEEREVDELASDLIFPATRLSSLLPPLPLDTAAVERLATRANVSPVMVACRLASLATDLGLVNAAVIAFKDGKKKWTWSKTLNLPETLSSRLLPEVIRKEPEPHREVMGGAGETLIASSLASPYMTIVFIQILPSEVGGQQTEAEQRRALEAVLFGDDAKFREQMNGCFGSFNGGCDLTEVSIEAALTLFYARYGGKWSGHRLERFMSSDGRDYVRLRLVILSRK